MSGNTKLAAVGRRRTHKRNLDTPIAGPGGYLSSGDHEVTLREVDLSGFEKQNYIDFVFEGVTGSLHNQRVWTISYQNNDEYHPAFIAFINSLFCDAAIYETLDDLVADEALQEGVFATFKGMRLKITIDYSEGYRVVFDEGKYALIDAKTKQQLDSRRFSTVNEAREVAVAKKMKRSWPTVKRYEALDDETITQNRKHFDNAITGLRQASETVSHPRQIFDINAFRHAANGGKPSSS